MRSEFHEDMGILLSRPHSLAAAILQRRLGNTQKTGDLRVQVRRQLLDVNACPQQRKQTLGCDRRLLLAS